MWQCAGAEATTRAPLSINRIFANLVEAGINRGLHEEPRRVYARQSRIGIVRQLSYTNITFDITKGTRVERLAPPSHRENLAGSRPI